MKNDAITMPGVSLLFSNAESSPPAFVLGHEIPDAVSISPPFETVKPLLSGKPIALAGNRSKLYEVLTKEEIQIAREAIDSGRTGFEAQDVD